ncbi:flagellar assembly protein FliW [Fonticella tunisiensis]|uniref:Flagellar assembly factor FliW n=1 Tax=Fonticella tunisiensis TaxID=1096341 RepID=A0A4V3ES65_9CLOT|nr:flagellar assembly protein FliW [Fonticella tunisiensis]TDT50621.1 flagellar assembly factor FliW [Fonticella tunisiensis]
MKIGTRFFGEIEIDEKEIIKFKYGIPGFEHLKEFVILNLEDNPNLKCLQSVEEKSICLMMISPWTYFKDYEIKLSDNEVEELEIEKERDVLIYNIITVRGDKITANLLAPIVINIINNKGKQIILSDSKYSIRQEIPCL